jgi:hypothetical protein
MRNELELKNLRPKITVEAKESAEIELFQNEVLRPILKYQHALFVMELEFNPLIQKILFQSIPEDKKRMQLKTYLISSKEVKFQLLGQISGMFTNEEFQFYKRFKKEIDKRIFAMLIDRILSIKS